MKIEEISSALREAKPRLISALRLIEVAQRLPLVGKPRNHLEVWLLKYGSNVVCGPDTVIVLCLRFLSGCRESNSGYRTPSPAYYLYTTPRNLGVMTKPWYLPHREPYSSIETTSILQLQLFFNYTLVFPLYITKRMHSRQSRYQYIAAATPQIVNCKRIWLVDRSGNKK